MTSRFSRLRFALPSLALACGSLAWLSTATQAEPVQHTFTGVVHFVTDGSGGALDLTSTFAPGQGVTIVIEIERSTPGAPQGDATFYLGAITQYSFSFGSYGAAPGPASSSSGVLVGNDVQEFPAPSGRAGPVALGAETDYYRMEISTPGSPPLGTAIPDRLVIDLIDNQGTALSDASLPRTIPDLSEFEVATCFIEFLDNGQVGAVAATLISAATPASATTWGAVKATYRD